MSFYRSLLAATAAVALMTPAFADDAANAAQNPADTSATTQQIASADQQSSNAIQEKINLNKASAKELMKIKGLNASKAKALVAYRKKHGEFKSVDELNSVKGFKKMKPASIKAIQDQLSVE